MNGDKIVIVLAVVALVIGCRRTAPQRPSQRNGVRVETAADTAALALLSASQRLADAADREVARYVRTRGEEAGQTGETMLFAQSEVGSWERWIVRTDEGNTPQKNEEWTLRMVVTGLDGTMLLDSEATYRIGREELPRAVEEAVAEAHHGDELEIVCPWYTAYGAMGNEYIEAYQNVIIQLYIR